MKIIASFLCLVILLGNIGLSRAAHFCGGLEVNESYTFGGGHFDCGMHNNLLGSEKDCTIKETNISQSDCCSDIINKIEITDEYINNLSTNKIEIKQITLFYSAAHFLEVVPSPLFQQLYSKESPPLLFSSDFQSTLQTYRL